MNKCMFRGNVYTLGCGGYAHIAVWPLMYLGGFNRIHVVHSVDDLGGFCIRHNTTKADPKQRSEASESIDDG